MPHWNGTADISRGRKLLLALLTLWVAGAAYALPADEWGGALIEVDDGVVAVAGDGMCSLIEAFENAVAGDSVHADCEPGSASADTIALSPGSLYTLTAIHNSDAGPAGLPSVTTQILVAGNGAVIERSSAGAPPFRLFHVAAAGDLTLTELTLRNGLLVDPADTGAGIFNQGTLIASQVTIHNSTNSPAGGGAISNAGELAVGYSTLRNNSGPGSGAGILNAAGATATVTHSTLVANGCGGPGCGIHNTGTLTVINSTLSGTSGPLANGLNNAGTAVLEHVTMAGNSGGMPHSFLNSGQATLRNTMIAGAVDDIDSCSGAPVVFEGANLIEDESCGCAAEPGCLTGDPLLGTLGDNGGPTETHALSADSIAVDAADGVFCLDDDQRGVSRPQGDDCDIGAFELEVSAGEPELVFDPASLDFGDVVVGTTSAAQNASLQNIGDGGAAGLNFNDISAAGYDVDTGDCTSELPAGDSCEVVITFTPPGEGSFAPTLVASHDGGPPGLLALSGNGIPPAPPAVTVDPESLETTLETGQSMPLELMIGNAGDATLDWEVVEDSFQIPGDIAQFSGNVLAVQEWDDGNGPALYIGGAFANIDGVAFGGVARWDGASWQPLGTGVSGITRVETLTVFDGDLIAGGNFTSAGGEPAFRVARWDGENWSPLGSGSLADGMNNTVNALTEYNGDLVAGGTFSSAGGQAVNRVARWDGSAWVPMGAGMNQTVNALAVFGGDLIAAGSFTQADGQPAGRIARWDGSAWSPLGAGVDSIVLELAVFDGELIAGGLMSQAGGIPAENIARWDGTQWSALDTGTDGAVRALTVFDGALIAAGRFGMAGSENVDNIARWDGGGWSPLGTGITTGSIVDAIHGVGVWDGGLVAGGSFGETGNGAEAHNIAVWDGDSWWPVAEFETLECALPDWASANPDGGAVAGGDQQAVDVVFDAAGQTPGMYEANLCIGSNDPAQPLIVVPLNLTVEAPPGEPELAFDPASLDFGDVVVGATTAPQNATLQNVGDGDAPGLFFNDISAAGYDVATGDCGSELPAGDSCEVVITFTPPNEGPLNPTLVASTPGHPPALLAISGNGIVQDPPVIDVDPESLAIVLRQGEVESMALNIANLGEAALDWLIPEDFSQFDRRVNAIAVWDDGSGPALYVGGELASEFGGIARWDGESWLPLGNGVGPAPSARAVRSLAVYGGELIAAGTFLEAGGHTVNRIARWDGNRWAPLGSGLDGTANGGSLVVYNGELIVGGNFDQAGGVAASKIARWDGNQWSPLGAGTNSQVAALTVYDGKLIAGGGFTSAGGVAVNRIAAWDGTEWSPVGAGFTGSVLGLGTFDGDLIAGGSFTASGDDPLNRIARWDGSDWSPLGDGAGDLVQVYAAREFGGDLIASGLGGAGAYRWDGASWSPLGGGLSAISGTTVVEALGEFDGALFAGGRFTHAGGQEAFNIAGWDGAEWSALVADPAACRIPEWLTVNPRSGTLEGGDAEQTTAIFDTRELVPGDYEATLCVLSNDPSGGLTIVPVELTVTEPPVADISPDSFAFEVGQGGSADDVLNIGNLGPVDLEWNIGAGDADIVVFDDVNFTVPATQTGGSVRWDTGETCECDDEPFNFNMWRTNQTGELAFFWPSGGVTANAGGVSDGDIAYAVLEPGATVGPASDFISNIASGGTAHWRQADGVDGYLGFRFVNPDTQAVNYGYARITTTGTGGHPATVVGWAYNEAGDPITVLPLAAEGCDDPADIPWLNVAPAAGTTPPGGNVPVDVTVEAGDLEPGGYQANLCVSTNDPAALLVEIPVTLDVLGDPPPEIDVDPASLSATVLAGQVQTQSLTIANAGVETLEWQVTENRAGRGMNAPVMSGAYDPARVAELESGLFMTRDPQPTTGGAAATQPTGGIVDCENEPGIIIQDDGTAEEAYFLDPDSHAEVTLVERFTPGEYPATFTSLCVAFVSLGASSLDFEIVAFADDGPDGGPGTELGVRTATAEGIPVGELTVVWSSFDISSFDLSIGSGSVYIGARWATGTNIFLVADESPGNPLGFAGGFVTADNIDDWFPSEAVFPEYRALFVRAVEAPAEPPVDCSLPDWIAVSPGAGSVPGGGAQEIEVAFDAVDLLPGDYEANLCIASNDPVNGLVVVPVALTVEEFVVVPGELSLEPAALNFGDVSTGMSSTMSLTVSNTAEPGAESLELTAIELVDGAQVFEISGGDCALGLELAPGQSCDVEVRFSPGAEIDYFGAVVVTTIDGQDGTVELAGTGAEPPGNDIFADRFEE